MNEYNFKDATIHNIAEINDDINHLQNAIIGLKAEIKVLSDAINKNLHKIRDIVSILEFNDIVFNEEY